MFYSNQVRAPFLGASFHSKDLGGKLGYRVYFIFGIVFGGFVAALVNGGWNPSLSFGMFEAIYGTSLAVKVGVLTAGGFCWGFGSRMAGGCTSGNSISGLAKGSLASLTATVGFMVAGIAITYLINFVAGTL